MATGVSLATVGSTVSLAQDTPDTTTTTTTDTTTTTTDTTTTTNYDDLDLSSIREQIDQGIEPPINPLPSFYELHKIDYPGSADPGIAPPVNPIPYIFDN